MVEVKLSLVPRVIAKKPLFTLLPEDDEAKVKSLPASAI